MRQRRRLAHHSSPSFLTRRRCWPFIWFLPNGSTEPRSQNPPAAFAFKQQTTRNGAGRGQWRPVRPQLLLDVWRWRHIRRVLYTRPGHEAGDAVGRRWRSGNAAATFDPHGQTCSGTGRGDLLENGHLFAHLHGPLFGLAERQACQAVAPDHTCLQQQWKTTRMIGVVFSYDLWATKCFRISYWVLWTVIFIFWGIKLLRSIYWKLIVSKHYGGVKRS